MKFCRQTIDVFRLEVVSVSSNVMTSLVHGNPMFSPSGHVGKLHIKTGPSDCSESFLPKLNQDIVTLAYRCEKSKTANHPKKAKEGFLQVAFQRTVNVNQNDLSKLSFLATIGSRVSVDKGVSRDTLRGFGLLIA